MLTVRKLGAPGRRELARGAIATAGIRVVNDEVVGALGISQASLDAAAECEGDELARRERAYRGDRPPVEVLDRTGILIDDGLATGSTMRAAVAVLRTRDPARIVVAVPTAAADSLESLRSQADEVLALATLEPYHAVGVWYGSFEQTGDEEVRSLLEAARRALARSVGSREVG